MVDNESEIQTRSPLRASNTVSTLKPVDITNYGKGFSGEVPNETFGGPAIDTLHDEEVNHVQRPLFPAGDFESDFAPVENLRKLLASQPDEDGDSGAFAYTPEPSERSLRARVLKLEEQMDSLLDRIALFNIKASHKI